MRAERVPHGQADPLGEPAAAPADGGDQQADDRDADRHVDQVDVDREQDQPDRDRDLQHDQVRDRQRAEARAPGAASGRHGRAGVAGGRPWRAGGGTARRRTAGTTRTAGATRPTRSAGTTWSAAAGPSGRSDADRGTAGSGRTAGARLGPPFAARGPPGPCGLGGWPGGGVRPLPCRGGVLTDIRSIFPLVPCAPDRLDCCRWSGTAMQPTPVGLSCETVPRVGELQRRKCHLHRLPSHRFRRIGSCCAGCSRRWSARTR